MKEKKLAKQEKSEEEVKPEKTHEGKRSSHKQEKMKNAGSRTHRSRGRSCGKP
jgi:hypothetical protein